MERQHMTHETTLNFLCCKGVKSAVIIKRTSAVKVEYLRAKGLQRHSPGSKLSKKSSRRRKRAAPLPEWSWTPGAHSLKSNSTVI